jgi:hypothetical protein
LVGTKVGQLLAQDPDSQFHPNLSFCRWQWISEIITSLQSMKMPPLVRTNSFDYETDDHNYHSCTGGLTNTISRMRQSFNINLLNIIEDNDGDEIEDYYDPDDDNDGFLIWQKLPLGLTRLIKNLKLIVHPRVWK